MKLRPVEIKGEHGPILIPRVPISESGVRLRLAEVFQRVLSYKSRAAAISMAISMIDLTSLEGSDCDARIIKLCERASTPFSDIDANNKGLNKIPAGQHPVAAVCVYPNFIRLAKENLVGTGVQVASVVGGFPAGQIPLSIRLKELEYAISCGADEIDMVISRGSFLSGFFQQVYDEIRAFKLLCGERVHLKVILEVGELATYENIRLASWIAMEAGADFIKTSTGKIPQASSLAACLVMLYAIQEFFDQRGVRIGMKPAGGIKTADQALNYLVLLKEVLGVGWLSPSLFRFGASSLLGDLISSWVELQLAALRP